MESNFFSTQNWSHTFNVWIEGIQVTFQPVVELERALIRGGLLRKVRSLSRVKFSAILVSLFFIVHCSSLRASVEEAVETVDLDVASMDAGYVELGTASWYGSEEDGFAGRPTASGEIFDPNGLTCAHRTLPLGSLVIVENLDNGRWVKLRVTDRGPFVRGRMLDVSRRGAKALGFEAKGVGQIRLRLVNPDGSPAPFDTAKEDEAEFAPVQTSPLHDPTNLQRLTRFLDEALAPMGSEDADDPNGRFNARVLGNSPRQEVARRSTEETAKRLGDRDVEPFIRRRR
ncbi:MAG: septal ring lytic transglycosylase RlpA family protein [Firmicutes bacterium]|nr:septal ring lytic transglycosylase RlpA family protein [Bacillota bacterium]